jgi:ABC-type Fe3+/spermidine/putrescine transport system ATPase subunit
MTMIEVQRLSKSYRNGVKALNDISFQLKKGTLTTVVGPSGCGKTTLLKILAGFLRADSGRLLFNEKDVTGLPTQKRETAIMFQNYALWPHMNIYDNIAYGLKLKKTATSIIAQKVAEVLDLVELDKDMVKRRYPLELSGGQQQRVALARALVVSPKILLLDEPLSNLDAKVRQKLRVEIHNIQHKLGLTALYVTHDQEEALSISDTVILMDRGQIIQTGTPQEIYNHPVNDFAAEFLGNSNVIIGEIKSNQIYINHTPVMDTTFPNGKAKVIVRAADIVLNGPSSITSGISVNGRLVERMFIGGIHRYLIRLGGQEIFADTLTEMDLEQEVIVSIPWDKLFVFPVLPEQLARKPAI